MLSFLVRHSLLLMFVMAIAGFLLPTASLALFPYLPISLFLLMTMTLLGMKQGQLIGRLKSFSVWRYACLHGFGMMLIMAAVGYLFSFSSDLLLACVATAATGVFICYPSHREGVGV